jgi:FMN-dependent NADH-azoreductase
VQTEGGSTAQGQTKGRDGLKKRVTLFRTGFPDIHFTMDNLVAENDKVTVQYRFKGTHLGKFLGLPASRNKIDVGGILIARVCDGKIESAWSVFDSGDMMKQLGVMPPHKVRRLLHIDSSPRGAQSYTRMVSKEFVTAWKSTYPDGIVTYVDLTKTVLPPMNAVTAKLLHQGYVDESTLTPAELQGVREVNGLVDQFLVADYYVIGAPMYFSHVPALLKAYMDFLPYFGKTVAMTPRGPEGLVTGKKAMVITSRGFDYSEGSPIESFDLQMPWMKNALAFIGITDTTFINMNGLDYGEEAINKAITHARSTIYESIEHWAYSPA